MSKKYLIVEASTSQELSSAITAYLDKGWELHKGPILSFDKYLQVITFNEYDYCTKGFGTQPVYP